MGKTRNNFASGTKYMRTTWGSESWGSSEIKWRCYRDDNSDNNSGMHTLRCLEEGQPGNAL